MTTPTVLDRAVPTDPAAVAAVRSGTSTVSIPDAERNPRPRRIRRPGALLADIEPIATLDHNALVPRHLLGEPADDGLFLAEFSGPHKETVLDVIAGTTKTLPESLRSECEVREVTFIAADLREAVELTDGAPR